MCTHLDEQQHTGAKGKLTGQRLGRDTAQSLSGKHHLNHWNMELWLEIKTSCSLLVQGWVIACAHPCPTYPSKSHCTKRIPHELTGHQLASIALHKGTLLAKMLTKWNEKSGYASNIRYFWPSSYKLSCCRTFDMEQQRNQKPHQTNYRRSIKGWLTLAYQGGDRR